MKDLFFWNNWNKESSLIYSFCLTLFISVSVYFIFVFLLGTESYYKWQTDYTIEKIKTSLDAFEVGLFQFDIEANQHIIFQNYFGENITISYKTCVFIFFGTLILLLITLTILSFLNNWIYYFGTTIILGWFIAQQPSVLFLDFRYATFLQLLPIILIGGLSYYYFAFNRNVKFLWRFFFLSIITLLYYILIFYFSENKFSLLYLYSYGSIITIIISCLFIAFVSFEIVYGFLKLISLYGISGQKQGNSLHFVFIFIIYLANIVLHYLQNAHKIQFDLLTFSPFILLLVSSLLGIYGFRDRSVMFNLKLPFSPFGGVIYLCWAAVCFLTISFYFQSGNDSMVEVFEDIIHLTHIGFGLGFFMYVILNYQKWLNENKPVAKIIYTHQWVSFYSVYGTGILVFLTLFFYSNMFTLQQAKAGYYSTVGDAYLIDNEEVLAEEYYGQSLKYEFQNHKSNYTLANIFLNRQNTKDAGYLFKKALLKKPTPQAFASVARILNADGQTLEALFQLKKGIRQFPQSAELNSNLALLFDKINMKDSAVIYLNKSLKISNNDCIKANKLAYFAKLRMLISDTTYLSENSNNLILTTNKIVYNSVLGLPNNIHYIVKDSIMTDILFSYLTNKFLSDPTKIDSLEIDNLEYLSKIDTNASFRSGLSYLKAVKYFYNNKPLDAVRMIDDLQIGDEHLASYYLNTIGLWSLKLGLFQMAADIFEISSSKGDDTNLINKSIALAEAEKPAETFKTLQSFATEDTNKKYLITKFSKIYAPKISIITLNGSDVEKYSALHYRKSQLSDVEIGNLFYGINNQTYKFKAAKDLFYFYFKQNELDKCAEILNETEKMVLNDSQKSDFQVCKILFFIEKKDIFSINQELLHPVALTNANAYLIFARAWVFEQNNNSDEAKKLYQLAANSLLHNTYIVQKSAIYLAKNNSHAASYNILLNGITLNAYDAELYKFYTLQSIWYGIPSFAENALEKLKNLISFNDFKRFEQVYFKEKAAFEKKMQE